MKSQHDIEKEQAVGPEASISPGQLFPQPPRQPPRQKRNRWVVIGAVILALALMLSLGVFLIPNLIQHPGSQATPTASPAAPTPPSADITPTPAPGVTQGPQAGPSGVSDPAYWDKIIGTQPGVNKVERVSFANIMGTPSLQALVTVRYTGADVRLDVYVFNNITSAHPKQIFKLAGLVKGDAKISGYNTVMTAEVDKNSSINTGKAVSTMTPDLFREFAWSAKEGTVVQTAFPGIYPDLTRYQAEADQARVNSGQDTWKNDPVKVATAFETQFLAWQRTVKATLLSGGGPRDVYAIVRVQESPAQGAQSQGPSIKVTLSRLEGNTHNFWVGIAVEDEMMLTLTNIDARSQVSSPVTLEGTGAAFEAVIGRAVIYDHLYTDIGHAQVTGTNGMGKTSYSTKVIYTSSFRQGVQEGVVAVYENNGGISDEAYAAVMIKVLLNPEPGVTLGPLPCPDSVKDPSYWTPFVSAPPDIRVADSVSCGNLLGKPSLQAMVVARDILGGGPVYRSIFVFDKITDPKPQLLFQVGHLLHGNAQISGYSTIMTAEVDVNSSINKGKLEAGLTTDLFREFKWSDGAGTFVQVAFPGLYPDLTRWQAEQDQRLVDAGQDTWKLDAVQTTQHALKLLNRSATNPLTLLSGGDPHDLTATVRAESFPQGAGVAATIITLSRLEGNANDGIWEITAVQANDFGITSPQSGHSTLITNPVTVKGFGGQFEGEVGNVVILDHLYTEIGREIARGTGGFTASSFAVDVHYTASFQSGTQEGIVVLYQNSGGGIPAVAMVKVLISK